MSQPITGTTGTGTGASSIFARLGNRRSQLSATLRAHKWCILKWVLIAIVVAGILYWLNNKLYVISDGSKKAAHAEEMAGEALGALNGTDEKPGLLSRFESFKESIMAALGLSVSPETGKFVLDPDGRLSQHDILWEERDKVTIDLDGDGKPDDLAAAFKRLNIAIYGGKGADGKDYPGLVTSMQTLESRQNTVINNNNNVVARAEAAARAQAAELKNEQVRRMIVEIKEANPGSLYASMSEADIAARLNDGNMVFENGVIIDYTKIKLPAATVDTSKFATKEDVKRLDGNDQALARGGMETVKRRSWCLAPSVSERQKKEARAQYAPILSPAPQADLEAVDAKPTTEATPANAEPSVQAVPLTAPEKKGEKKEKRHNKPVIERSVGGAILP